MPESLSQYLVDKYLADLRKELVIHGISGERMQQILTESDAHLTEAVEQICPASGVEIERVIRQFGSPATMAKQLASQDLRAQARRRYLWPLAVVPVALIGLHSRMMLIHISYGQWVSLFLLTMGFVLVCLGFRARKPMVLEFGIVAATLIGLQTIWLGIATYPVTYQGPNIGPWIETVGRLEVNDQMAAWNKQIAKEQEVVQAVKRGKQVFSSTNMARSVPEMFTYKGKYWLPEGVRESVLFKPGDLNISPQLRVATWDEAVTAWTTQPYGPGADQIIEDEPHNITLYENCIRDLAWIQNQSVLVRFALAFQKVASEDLVLCGLALFATNGGWMIWLFGRWLGRIQRRRTYRPEALA